MKDKDYELSTEPKPSHEWRIENQCGWLHVTNGLGGYLVRDRELANIMLDMEIKGIKPSPGCELNPLVKELKDSES